jgi:hypothetical protein
VIDSEPNDLAQDCDRAVVIFWWPEYMWTSELHRTVAHASQDQIIGKRECAAGQGGGGHRFQIRNYQLRIKNENGETSKIQRSMEHSGRAIKRSGGYSSLFAQRRERPWRG